MLIQTQFYDGRRYCKGHGKGDLLNHDLCELAGTPVVVGAAGRKDWEVIDDSPDEAAEKTAEECFTDEEAAMLQYVHDFFQ